MKVGYAIGCLTLEDLQAFTTRFKTTTGKERSYADALKEQDSYQYRTFYMCPTAYHWIRGAVVVVSNEENDSMRFPKAQLPSTFVDLFYTEGTMQHTWNQLYNDYCDRVRAYVKEKDLQSG